MTGICDGVHLNQRPLAEVWQPALILVGAYIGYPSKRVLVAISLKLRHGGRCGFPLSTLLLGRTLFHNRDRFSFASDFC